MMIFAYSFVLVLGLIVACYSLYIARLEQAEGAELRKRLKESVATAATKKSRLLKPLEQLSSVAALNTWLTKLGGISQPLQSDITQAGLTFSVSTLLLSALFLAAVAFLIVRFFTLSSVLAVAA